MHGLRRLPPLLSGAGRLVGVPNYAMIARALAILFLLTIPHLVSATEQPPINDWKIIPGKRVGPITRNTSEERLRHLFSHQNVRREDIPIGEGEVKPGTVIFPFSDNRLAILWEDDKTRERPKEIRLNGNRSAWKTDKGIALGMTLKQLEKLNSRPFYLMGFAWDYGGTIVDCNRGRLQELGCTDPEDRTKKLKGRTILLRLAPDRHGNHISEADKIYVAVMGEKEFSSSHPSMQKLNPKVYEMIVYFDSDTR